MLGPPGKTPFEIMGSRDRGDRGDRGDRTDRTDRGDGPHAADREPADGYTQPAGQPQGPPPAVVSWMYAAKAPVVLRLPRALLVAVLVLLLLALLIAFLAGRAQGFGAGHQAGVTERRHHERNMRALGVGGMGGVDGVDGVGGQGGAETDRVNGMNHPAARGNASGGRVWQVTDGEQRLPGHNYCLMGYWREPEAKDVAAYFAAAGFDVGIVPFNNNRFHVAVLSQAIPSGDPDFRNRKLQADVTIRQYLRGYLNQAGENTDMQRMLTWELFKG